MVVISQAIIFKATVVAVGLHVVVAALVEVAALTIMAVGLHVGALVAVGLRVGAMEGNRCCSSPS